MGINIAQVLFNSVVTGSLLRFPNFAHAELVTVGAYAAYVVMLASNLNFPLALVAAFVASSLVAVASHLLAFKPLSKRGAGMIELMVASIGVGVFIRYVVQEIWGAAQRTYGIVRQIFDFGVVRATDVDLAMIGSAVAFVVILHLFLVKTKLGKAMRATSDNPSLAMASGINVDRILLIVWLIGGGVAGVAGAFYAAKTRLVPILGWEILLPIFAVVVLGGIGSFYGAIAAAYIMGLAENLGVVLLANLGLSTGYKPAIAFAILIAVLLLKPTGLAGLKVRRVG